MTDTARKVFVADLRAGALRREAPPMITDEPTSTPTGFPTWPCPEASND